MINVSDRGVEPSNAAQRSIWHAKIWQGALLTSIALGFTACGGGGTGGAISGQLSAPTNANLNQTVVAAFVCTNACQSQSDITDTLGGRTVVSSTASSASYQLPNLPTGKYFVLAVQDTNGSGKLDTGDLLGAVSGVPSPAANVNIKLEPATVAAAGSLNPLTVARSLLRER